MPVTASDLGRSPRTQQPSFKLHTFSHTTPRPMHQHVYRWILEFRATANQKKKGCTATTAESLHIHRLKTHLFHLKTLLLILKTHLFTWKTYLFCLKNPPLPSEHSLAHTENSPTHNEKSPVHTEDSSVPSEDLPAHTAPWPIRSKLFCHLFLFLITLEAGKLI